MHTVSRGQLPGLRRCDDPRLRGKHSYRLGTHGCTGMGPHWVAGPECLDMCEAWLRVVPEVAEGRPREIRPTTREDSVRNRGGMSA